MNGFAWTPPSRPRDRRYKEIEAEIAALKAGDEARVAGGGAPEGMLLFRALAEHDLWWFLRNVSTFGRFKIKDPGHKMYGKRWIDHPQIFEALREYQEILEKRLHMVLLWEQRHGFKTTKYSVGANLWLLARDAMETIAIFTHKISQVGENILGADIGAEIAKNDVLRDHWPQFREVRESSTDRVTISRPLGPREPSIAVYSILNPFSSIHPTRIFLDNCMSPEVAGSTPVLRKIDSQIDKLMFLRGDTTPVVFIDTPCGPRDPIVVRQKAGFFQKTIRRPARLPDGTPSLRSEAFLREQKKSIRDKNLYYAQYDLQIVAPGQRHFRKEWLRYYQLPPERQALGCRIDMILDYAGGERNSDDTTIWVRGTANDGRRYLLDHWREKIGYGDAVDLLFGTPQEADFNSPLHRWKRHRQGLVRYWSASYRRMKIWVEHYAASAWLEALRKEAKRAKLDNPVLPLPPKGKGFERVYGREKRARIDYLQAPCRAGELVFPETGFGHGSRYGSGLEPDERDTLTQFLEDEYDVWAYDSGDGKDVVDNGLDGLAWPEQPELASLFRADPSADRAGELVRFDPHLAALKRQIQAGAAGRTWQAR